ncbi:hypothetical protein K469DRAFT_714692 [Zopfia rhizophila CBS 207.26]|uniref:Methyltransferase type 11 domain-containing protein n=1 Tax=Zopfia rhizophila CBS 207.26 TaxID=1314779 RepID=A0A6A6DMA8_9PEZI|nr:hypothetical protein K469DRAFT_714692 [Zopfia rhizophila CBS 207.26]
MVLLKVAERKKQLAKDRPSANTARTVRPAYGIDIFSSRDQTGNSPIVTYKNAAAMDVLDFTVLHTATFPEQFPFAGGVFSLVTTSLALHNVLKEGRMVAVKEIARVRAPGGKVILVDLYRFFKDHSSLLNSVGFEQVEVKAAGIKMMYGVLPCQILTAVKHQGQNTIG